MISYEEKKLSVYQGKADKPGILTVGIGHVMTGKSEKAYYTKGCYITSNECDIIFSTDLPKYTAKVDEALGNNWDTFNQFQKNAFTDIGFNKGPDYLNEYTEEVGDYFFFQFYNRHKVDKIPGILKRRTGEYLLSAESIYYHFEVLKAKESTNVEKLIDNNKPKDEVDDPECK
jgi:GH24 family phage-related lysozyme (muramidase)